MQREKEAHFEELRVGMVFILDSDCPILKPFLRHINPKDKIEAQVVAITGIDRGVKCDIFVNDRFKISEWLFEVTPFGDTMAQKISRNLFFRKKKNNYY